VARLRKGLDLKPGPFFSAAASRLDLRSRRGFPVTVAGAVAVVSFLGFLSIAESVIGTPPFALDVLASDTVSVMRNSICTSVMWIATLMGDVRVMIVETVVAAVLLAIWGHPRRAGSVVILVLAGVLVSETLKGVVKRSRPTGALIALTDPGSFSFPSGHALAGILLFVSLALMLAASRAPMPLRIWGSVAIALVGLTVGVSRVYLGVHFMSDVLASWLLGLTMLATWAAAVLVWGRSRPPISERIARPLVRSWWRWTLAAAGAAAVVISLVAETGVTPLG
jgi:undecaprenyl-diphosphatase